VCSRRAKRVSNPLQVANLPHKGLPGIGVESGKPVMSERIFTVAVLFAAIAPCAQGQWVNYPAPGTPRTRDGKPNLTAKAPRAWDGKPDLSGVWHVEYASPEENRRLFGTSVDELAVPGDEMGTFSRYSLDILFDFKPENSPMRPETAKLLKQNIAKRPTDAPTLKCLPLGPPRAEIFNYAPFKMIQAPGEITVLYEMDDMYRQIYTDGRKLPQDPQPSWMGYSVGKWEGDTLVVDAAGFNDKSWLDVMGHPHSEEMRIEERFHRRDFGHMDLSVTIDDPKMYTRPFTINVTEVLVPDSDVLESVCNEGEKDRAHMRTQ